MTLPGGASILAEASLSYLGLGPAPPAPSWGRMLLEAQSTVSSQPWAAIAPGLAIAATVLGLNLLGDGLRDRKSTRLNSSHVASAYAGFCLKKKNTETSDIS